MEVHEIEYFKSNTLEISIMFQMNRIRSDGKTMGCVPLHGPIWSGLMKNGTIVLIAWSVDVTFTILDIKKNKCLKLCARFFYANVKLKCKLTL